MHDDTLTEEAFNALGILTVLTHKQFYPDTKYLYTFAEERLGRKLHTHILYSRECFEMLKKTISDEEITKASIFINKVIVSGNYRTLD